MFLFTLIYGKLNILRFEPGAVQSKQAEYVK